MTDSPRIGDHDDSQLTKFSGHLGKNFCQNVSVLKSHTGLTLLFSQLRLREVVIRTAVQRVLSFISAL